MKKIIKRVVGIVVFLSIFFGIVMYAGYIGRPYENASYNYNLWQYFYEEDDDTLNVINIGSSAIYRYWAPTQAYSEQGFTSFTIGSNRQPFSTVPYVMEEVLKTQNPDLIVVEVRSLLNQRIYELQNDEKGQPEMQNWVTGIVANGMKYSSTRYNVIRSGYVEVEDDNELLWHIPLLKYHSLFYETDFEEIKNRISPTKHIYKSTFLNSNVKYIKTKSAKKELKGDYYLTDEQKTLLDNVVKMAQKHNVELLLIATPYILTKEDASMQKSLEDYIQEKNYPFVNFNDYVDEIGLSNKTDYYNVLHTNVVGAQKFTSYFAKYISDNYELDNVTLTESQKKDWDDAAKVWDKKFDKMKSTWESNCKKAAESAKK